MNSVRLIFFNKFICLSPLGAIFSIFSRLSLRQGEHTHVVLVSTYTFTLLANIYVITTPPPENNNLGGYRCNKIRQSLRVAANLSIERKFARRKF